MRALRWVLPALVLAVIVLFALSMTTATAKTAEFTAGDGWHSMASTLAITTDQNKLDVGRTPTASSSSWFLDVGQHVQDETTARSIIEASEFILNPSYNSGFREGGCNDVIKWNRDIANSLPLQNATTRTNSATDYLGILRE